MKIVIDDRLTTALHELVFQLITEQWITKRSLCPDRDAARVVDRMVAVIAPLLMAERKAMEEAFENKNRSLSKELKKLRSQLEKSGSDGDRVKVLRDRAQVLSRNLQESEQELCKVHNQYARANMEVSELKKTVTALRAKLDSLEVSHPAIRA